MLLEFNQLRAVRFVDLSYINTPTAVLKRRISAVVKRMVREGSNDDDGLLYTPISDDVCHMSRELQERMEVIRDSQSRTIDIQNTIVPEIQPLELSEFLCRYFSINIKSGDAIPFFRSIIADNPRFFLRNKGKMTILGKFIEELKGIVEKKLRVFDSNEVRLDNPRRKIYSRGFRDQITVYKVFTRGSFLHSPEGYASIGI